MGELYCVSAIIVKQAVVGRHFTVDANQGITRCSMNLHITQAYLSGRIGVHAKDGVLDGSVLNDITLAFTPDNNT